MNNGEWWAAVREAAQYRQKVKNNQIAVVGKEISRRTNGSGAGPGKSFAERHQHEHDKRGA